LLAITLPKTDNDRMAEFEEPLFEMEFVDDLDEAYDRREREQAEELAARAPGFDYYSLLIKAFGCR
jgi:hypothetical protein